MLFINYRYLPLLWTHLDLGLLQEVMILRYTDGTQMHMHCTFLSNNNFSLTQVVEIYAGLFNGSENRPKKMSFYSTIRL